MEECGQDRDNGRGRGARKKELAQIWSKIATPQSVGGK